MAHFFNPYDESENYNEVDLYMKIGDKRIIALWGGGPGGAQLTPKITPDGVVSRSGLWDYPQIDHTRCFTLAALTKGSVKIHAMLGPAPWAQMNVFVVGKRIIKREPPKVGQTLSWLCWAAAMDSYLAALLDPHPQSELKRLYATNPDTGAQEPNAERAIAAMERKKGQPLTTEEREAATKRNLKFMLEDLDMAHEVKPGHTLSFNYFFEKISARGRLWMCLDSGHSSHCMVVYGVAETGDNADAATVFVMDPMGKGGYAEKTLGTLKSYRTVVVAWNANAGN
ncbi:hypothetical protein [Phreatobacter stygius]|uniref:Uncharacterized protein n=1 Tax=Phreatobacter stygius TaxID=1940610 RepID=A0A4D7B425_9HYPH|nr:hypothetical protein [Phreatobacter stygius]QCI65278.1 hypothetical protein E8M01_14305 [Phreatobacter stygius]